MHQWWETLGQLYKMLQDADALGLSRDARRRLIMTIGALDTALLNCATVECPIRAVVLESNREPGQAGAGPTPAGGTATQETDSAIETCRNCRWWSGHRGTAGEGVCLLTRTEGTAAERSAPIVVHTLAHATANDPQVGAVLLTRLSYACSQWTPL